MKITDFVEENNPAFFNYFRQGNFYYSVRVIGTTDWFMFPIPLDDLGDATLQKEEKAIFLMRYINKAISDNTLVSYVG